MSGVTVNHFAKGKGSKIVINEIYNYDCECVYSLL